VVLGAAQGEAAFEVMGGALVDQFRYAGRAHERDGVDARVVADGFHDPAVTVDDIEDPVGEARLL